VRAELSVGMTMLTMCRWPLVSQTWQGYSIAFARGSRPAEAPCAETPGRGGRGAGVPPANRVSLRGASFADRLRRPRARNGDALPNSTAKPQNGSVSIFEVILQHSASKSEGHRGHRGEIEATESLEGGRLRPPRIPLGARASRPQILAPRARSEKNAGCRGFTTSRASVPWLGRIPVIWQRR